MGIVKIPNRPTGSEKPQIAKLLANFDTITDFLNLVPNANNVGAPDPDNLSKTLVNDMVAIDDSTIRRRSQVVLADTTYLNIVSGSSAGALLQVDAADLVILKYSGVIGKVTSSGWSGAIQLWFQIDGADVWNMYSSGGSSPTDAENFTKGFFSGSEVVSDPSPHTSAEFQLLTQAREIVLPGDRLPTNTVGNVFLSPGQHRFGMRYVMTPAGTGSYHFSLNLATEVIGL